jgi:hypothetical protein
MKNGNSRTVFEARKIKGIPRAERPRCGARTRAGGICQAQALLNKSGKPGRCRMHGGLSTGPKTKKGKATNQRRARTQMLERWITLRASGESAIQLSQEGRERIRNAAIRTMRMRHRKRQALGWCDWMLKQNADSTRRLWSDERRRVILHPYLQTLQEYGDQAFFELAEVAGFENLRKATDGTDLTAVILARYMPNLDIFAAAADLRKGAESK